jgi:hypothetical protein
MLGIAVWLFYVGGCSPIAELNVKAVYVVPLSGLAVQVVGTALERFWPGCTKYW